MVKSKSSKKNATSSKKKKPTKAKAATTTTKASNNKALTCDETGEKVFVATATLSDIRNPPTSQKRKVLLKIPSPKVRLELYDELALCLEDRETRLLPKYGGRPWSVVCRVQDGSTKSFKGGVSPFFRWVRSKLELAVLPHILEKIPDPPNFPGYTQTDWGVVRQKRSRTPDNNKNNTSNNNLQSDHNDDDSEEEQEEQYDNLTPEEIARMEALVGREVSVPSRVAWNHRLDARQGAPLPLITIKWICPLRQTFTSRKAAWDHAVELAKAEQFVDRFIRGRGKNGLPLKPFRPTKAQALQAGKVRFLRDGLWVVGQEQNWQNDRYVALERQQQRQEERQQQQLEQQQQEEQEVEQQESTKRPAVVVVDEQGEPLKKRRRITGQMLYVAVNRITFREQRLQELKAKTTTALKKQEVVVSHGPSDNSDEGDTTNGAPKEKKVKKTTAKVGMPEEAPKKPTKRSSSAKNNVNKVSFTLTEADKELNVMWRKALSDDERYYWNVKAESSFQRKLDDDDHARWDQARQEQEEESEEEGSDEESESEGEEVEEDNVDGDIPPTVAAAVDEDTNDATKEKEAGDVDNGGNEESEAESCVVLATERERRLWETFHEAEMKVWKMRVAKNLPVGPQKLKEMNPPEESFEDYQLKVYEAVFGMTRAKYEAELGKSMRPSDRRKYQKDADQTKELMMYGMKQLHPSAHSMLEKRIDKWVTSGLGGAKRRELNSKKLAPPTAAGILSPGGSKLPNLVQSVEVAPPISSFSPTRKLSSASASNVAEATTSMAPMTSIASVGMNSNPPAFESTPISPSPELVAPLVSQNGVSLESVTVPAVTSSAGSAVQTGVEDIAVVALSVPIETSPPTSVVASAPVETTSIGEADNLMVAPVTTVSESLVEEQLPVAAASPDKTISSEEVEEEEAEEEEKEVEVIVPSFIPTDNFCMTDTQVKMCHDASMEHFEAVMRTVKAKDLTRELVDGFDLLRERGRGRYDMELPAFESKQYGFLNDIKEAPWMPMVRQVLGEDVTLIHKGCFLSLPDAANQNYHQDGPHLHKTSQRPCHAVNVFIPLVDMTLRHGPTEFCLGSHVLGQEDWDRRYISLPMSKAGVPIMFDYRLGHRGLANSSKDPRPVVYCTYARSADGKEFRDSANFSRKRYRKLGDLVEKPLSREARKERRQEQHQDTWQTLETSNSG